MTNTWNGGGAAATTRRRRKKKEKAEQGWPRNAWTGAGNDEGTGTASQRRRKQKRKIQDKDGLATRGRVQETTRARGRRHDGGGVWPHAHPSVTAAGNREISDCAAAAKGESAWACSKEMLQTFRQPRSEVWDRNDTWERNDPEVSKMDSIFINLGVAPAIFPEFVHRRCSSDHNVTELFSVHVAFEVPLPMLFKPLRIQNSKVVAAKGEAT